MPTKAKKVPVEEYEIELRLTKEDAIVVKSVLGRLRGSGKIREATSRVYWALDGVGVEDRSSPFEIGSEPRLLKE